ncbi:MAG: class I SAM-dependent methyltransferase [Rhizobiaceae bacterium]
MTTPLAEKLKRQIMQTGPISITEYMSACLFDPQLGYYTAQEPFGRGGDFITAPEISQMFGELVAIWTAAAWQAAGSPKDFAFVEIGPGRGTLMADMLRTFRKSPTGFLDHADVFMIETSPRLTGVQKAILDSENDGLEWLQRFDDLPDLPAFVVANELFDAIPVRQYVKSGGVWRERVVGIDSDGNLVFAVGAGALDIDLLPDGAAGEPDGAIFEISPAREALAESIACKIADHGGMALFFDYGHLQSAFGDTLQAVRNHEFDPVLSHPGQADLTSHVDFAALALAAEKAGASTSFLTQGEFLVRMGIVERAGRLGANLDEDGRKQIAADTERLAGADGMGEMFKAMAMFRPGMKPAPF